MRTLLITIIALMFAGCSSFTVKRTANFINDMNEVISVDYGVSDDHHESIFYMPSTGMRLPYKTDQQVRVTMPNGTTFMAWRNMSPAGMLYKTADGEWEFFAEGTGCIVARREKNSNEYIINFQGVLSRMTISKEEQERNRAAGSSGSTPQGFSSRQDDTSKDNKIEAK